MSERRGYYGGNVGGDVGGIVCESVSECVRNGVCVNAIEAIVI